MQRSGGTVFVATCILLFALFCSQAIAGDLNLNDLLQEASQKSPETLASESRARAWEHKVPQAGSLPDPMFMFGYQNEGYRRYTFGEMLGAQWMFSASQTFPFPGKLGLKEQATAREAEGMEELYRLTRLRIAERIKQLFFDLLYAHKVVDLLNERTSLFSKIEDAALARYASGRGMQQDVLMAQTEKYMIRERSEMAGQRIQTVEGLLNAAVGRKIDEPLGNPVVPAPSTTPGTLDDLLRKVEGRYPEIRAREKAVMAAETRVDLNKKEYYPDFTITASLAKRDGQFEDMWSLTTRFNIPLYYRSKQRQAVHEAEASLQEAKHELEAVKFASASSVRENLSMAVTAERLMDLYRNGIIPKAEQDFETALAAYETGKLETVTVITSLKSLVDAEMLYWGQFSEREKAIARIETLTGEIIGYSRGTEQ